MLERITFRAEMDDSVFRLSDSEERNPAVEFTLDAGQSVDLDLYQWREPVREIFIESSQRWNFQVDEMIYRSLITE